MAARHVRRVVWALFIVYAILMLWLLFGQRMGTPIRAENYWDALRYRTNLLPFRTIAEFWQRGVTGVSIVNLGGNVIMFLPLGAALPVLFPRTRGILRCMGTVALIILVVETLQLFSALGSFDVDDLILNVLGSALGYGAFAGLRRLFPALFLTGA